MVRGARSNPSSTVWLLVLLLGISACSRPQSATEGTLQPVVADTLATWVEAGAPVMCYDLRSREAYDAAHIPGAVPVGDRPLSEFREILPVDINVALVFYNQDGVLPEASSAQEAASKHRFRRLYWLGDGFDAWVAGQHGTDGAMPVVGHP